MGSITTELYNSTYCRLCCEDCGQNGVFIFNGNTDSENISIVINKYLPVKVDDDGKFPRTICSNCHVQLHATISFFDILADGQKKLIQLAHPEEDSIQQDTLKLRTNSSLTGSGKEIKTYKRARGRPRKDKQFINSTPNDDNSELSIQTPLSPSSSLTSSPLPEVSKHVEELGKSRRKRKLPSRFSSSVQGKELEKVYREVGLPEDDVKANGSSVDPMIIGKVESLKGEDLGDVMVLPTLEEANRHQMKFRCDTCNQIFTQEPKFLEHLMQHAKECLDPISEPFSPPKKDQVEKKNSGHECDICAKVFRHTSSLSYHKETEHNDGRRYVCNKCPRSFKHRQLLRRHQLVHSSVRLHNCEECGASFKTKGNLLNHMLVHTGHKKYFCELCGQLFAHRTSLNLHTRWHSGEKPFECYVCKKRFTQKGNLQEHIRIHTGEKPFACNLCNRKFTTSSQCKLHLKRHTGERPWFCNMCGKTFLNKATWRCHLRRHKGEKPFDCTTCGRNFPEVWALKKHMRTHTGEKPYRCNICNKAFSDCSNLTKHKKCHLKDKMEEEEIEQERVVYLSYTDPMNPTSEVSEKFVVGNKTDQPLNEELLFMQVMDEMGNPLKFTLQDGTQLQVTTRDGRSLEIRTPDGQIIPVKLTTDSGEPVSPELTPVVIPGVVEDPLVDISTIELVTDEEEEQTLTLSQDFLQIS